MASGFFAANAFPSSNPLSLISVGVSLTEIVFETTECLLATEKGDRCQDKAV